MYSLEWFGPDAVLNEEAVVFHSSNPDYISTLLFIFLGTELDYFLAITYSALSSFRFRQPCLASFSLLLSTVMRQETLRQPCRFLEDWRM